MPHDLTHASFFSGVGGLDLGLERAGWRTVSFSEIDPYASAVLAERWPGVPNLGDITAVVRSDDGSLLRGQRGQGIGAAGGDWHRATLWTGGFPCQDLSVAGKRAGFAGERSSLAFAFLDLVEQHRPPAILLENVPGLLSSHGGKDFGALLGRLGDLGYWWAYRILDAQFFGVPQRRRRVFICALHAERGFGADSAAAVLSVGSRCHGHLAAGNTPRPAASDGLAAGISRALSTSQERLDADTESFVVSPPPDPGGVREADGLAGRLDDIPTVAATLNSGGNDGGFRTEPGEHLVYLKRSRYGEHGDPRRPDGNDAERWEEGTVSHSLDAIGHAPRTATAVLGSSPADDPLLPLGLDSHRYRCCGNGVVSNVAEWIGVRLARAMSKAQERAA